MVGIGIHMYICWTVTRTGLHSIKSKNTLSHQKYVNIFGAISLVDAVPLHEGSEMS
jgi:hypothetical protein